jgi:hypothetical protein
MAATPPLTRPPSPENEINLSALLFKHIVSPDLFKKEPGSDKPVDPSRPPLMEVKSNVIQVFINLQSKTSNLIGKFQEIINQSNSNKLRPVTKESPLPHLTQSSTASQQVSQHDNNHNDASTVLQSVSQATSPDLIKQVTEGDSTKSSKILQSLSVPERDSNSPAYVAFVSPSRSLLPEHLANQIASRLSSSPLQNPQQDLSSQLSHSPNLIVDAQVKMVGRVAEEVVRVAEEVVGRFDDSLSDSCFAEISPTTISPPENTLSNLSSSAPNNIQTPNLLPNPSPPKNPPLSTPPKAVNDKNNSTSCLDEALKFVSDSLQKCCNPTKISARPLVERANDSRVV